jgi:hypothetical protein
MGGWVSTGYYQRQIYSQINLDEAQVHNTTDTVAQATRVT